MREKWGVVIPAGGLVKDPLATALGTPRKALADIGGVPCIVRTLQAIEAAGFTQVVVVSGEDVREVISDDIWAAESTGHIENVKVGVEKLPDCEKFLFMPADTPFLTAEAILHFVDAVDARLSGAQENWYAAGLCEYKKFLEVLPGFEHPHIKLRDGDFMSGAFYATSRKGFFYGMDMFKDFSRNRKNQIAMLLKIGLKPLVKYLFHRVSITEGEETMGRFFNGTAIVIPDCDPWAMADIDTVDEYQRLQQVVR